MTLLRAVSRVPRRAGSIFFPRCRLPPILGRTIVRDSPTALPYRAFSANTPQEGTIPPQGRRRGVELLVRALARQAYKPLVFVRTHPGILPQLASLTNARLQLAESSGSCNAPQCTPQCTTCVLTFRRNAAVQQYARSELEIYLHEALQSSS